MDVLGAVAEGLVDLEENPTAFVIPDASVHTVAAAGFQADSQQTQIRAREQRALQRVAGHGSRVNEQAPRIRRLDEAGRAGQQGHPWTIPPIPRGGDKKRQRSVKGAMLLREIAAHHLPGPGLDGVAHTEPLLHPLLTFVKRGSVQR